MEVLLLLFVITFADGTAARLIIQQGRIPSSLQEDFDLIPVVGIATVELGGDIHVAYYFDCISDLNNGSGIVWSRERAPLGFEFVPIPSGESGKRLVVDGITHSDLDVYICSDRHSNDVERVNITAANPAIAAAQDRVGVVQGASAVLEVYVSGYPKPSLIWHRPRGYIITNSDEGVEFQEDDRILLLSNLRSWEAGTYTCTAVLEPSSPHSPEASTKIELDVYVHPVILAQPQSVSDAREWSDVTLTCSVSSNPPPSIQWEREGETQLPVSARASGNSTYARLTFNMIRYEDQGRYRCVADNRQTNVTVSDYAEITITPVLRLFARGELLITDLYYIDELSEVNLECFGTGNLEWTSSNGLEIPRDESSSIHQLYDHTRDALSVDILNFTSINNAVYTCKTDLTDAYERPISLSLLVTNSNPAAFIQPTFQYILAGNSTTIEATVYASPADSALVQWYHEERFIDTINNTNYTVTASDDGYIQRLTVNSVGEGELGEYTILVSLNDSNATDKVILIFLDPPSANVSLSFISVSEGDEVVVVCGAEGVGPLSIEWRMNNGSSLPSGVQQNRKQLFIAAASRQHAGLYVCSVSNAAGVDQDGTTLVVYYSPTVEISYSEMTSTLGQTFNLVFYDGDPGPTIVCAVTDGHPSPLVTWMSENGRDLPIQVLQIRDQQNSVTQLQWMRSMKFTDSGSYICLASNSIGTNSAIMELLVKIELSLITIYPNTFSIERVDQTFMYTVPLSYVGTTLVCVANGWPAPEVEWLKDGQPLSTGGRVTSQSAQLVTTVSATLTWTREFQNSDTGSYECVVRQTNTTAPLESQRVRLKAVQSSSTTSSSPTSSCNDRQSTLIYFQIRVFMTDCDTWEEESRSHIASEFRRYLSSVVGFECDCEFEENYLKVNTSPQCSSKVSGAVVFRGQIETVSLVRTKLLFCALLKWQLSSPLVRIDGSLRAVDGSCALEAGSVDGEECVGVTEHEQSGGSRLPTIGAIVSGIIGASLLIFIAEAIAIGCCVYKHCRQSKD